MNRAAAIGALRTQGACRNTGTVTISAAVRGSTAAAGMAGTAAAIRSPGRAGGRVERVGGTPITWL